ncbi:hypothetical protein LTR36_009170 [Oleoguttula mirabilis]|uniref:Mitochondrial division protein 1 n=1 Tax=Oleoguttula mirabilis TaxID=1507867 RepID=A0AAV9J6A1_9PEZI|nr:hypothetical protein LTR36_009170 [Oleoguttula mirabilis]
MASRGRSTSPRRPTRPHRGPPPADDDNFINTRQIEAFGRTVQATASQLLAAGSGAANFSSTSTHDPHSTPSGSGGSGNDPYRTALSSLHRTVRQPGIQRSVFSFARATPRELLRSNFNPSEIEHRALTFLPDELIRNAPQSQSAFSLFEGFKASLPEEEEGGEEESDRTTGKRKKHGRRGSKGQRLLEAPGEEKGGSAPLVKLKREKARLDHRLEMMGVRKTMCASEIREIDNKIANLNTMRKVTLDRLAGLEQEEHELEQEVGDLAERVEDLQEQLEDEAALATKSPAFGAVRDEEGGEADDSEEVEPEEIQPAEGEEEEEGEGGMGASFMSESIYGKLPKPHHHHHHPNPNPNPSLSPSSPKSKRKPHARPHHRLPNKRTISLPILHEHMAPGSLLKHLPAHNDTITALDFDAPFGTLVTAALDDMVRVWDLNAGRCMGLLEGHLASVRCLQVEDNIVATGSGDASIRLWDLGRADYDPHAPVQAAAVGSSITSKPFRDAEESEADADGQEGGGDQLFIPTTTSSEPPAVPDPSGDAMADCHLVTLAAHVAEITALDFRGSTLVSGSADKTLRQWDLEKGRCVQTLDVLWAAAQASTTNNVNAPATSSHAGAAGVATDSGGGWWRPTSGRLAGPSAAEADFVGALQVFDAALACGTADGMVRLWDLRSGVVHRSLVGHTGPVTALRFDDVYLVTGSRDRSVRIWDLRTGSIHDAYAYDSPISSMQFDARRIVAAAGEDVVKVYDKADGRHWDCGAGVAAAAGESGSGAAKPAVVERVRIKDGYLVEGRRDGVVGVWSC